MSDSISESGSRVQVRSIQMLSRYTYDRTPLRRGEAYIERLSYSDVTAVWADAVFFLYREEYREERWGVNLHF